MSKKSLNAQKQTDSFIADSVKSCIDDIIFVLEKKYKYNFSPATTLTIVNLTLDYINRLTDTIQSEDLVESEYYDEYVQ